MRRIIKGKVLDAQAKRYPRPFGGGKRHGDIRAKTVHDFSELKSPIGTSAELAKPIRATMTADQCQVKLFDPREFYCLPVLS